MPDQPLAEVFGFPIDNHSPDAIRTPFVHYMADPEGNQNFDWRGNKHYPRPDYVSSSRKRLAPQGYPDLCVDRPNFEGPDF